MLLFRKHLPQLEARAFERDGRRRVCRNDSALQILDAKRQGRRIDPDAKLRSGEAVLLAAHSDSPSSNLVRHCPACVLGQ